MRRSEATAGLRVLLAVSWLIMVGGAAACGTSGEGEQPKADISHVWPDNGGGQDVLTAPDPGGAADEGQPDTATTPDPGPQPPQPGEYGTICDDTKPCVEGHCYGSEQLTICTETCAGGCPEGFVCLPVDGTGDLCVPGGSADTDADTVPNVDDNCPLSPNKNQADMDSDSLGDVCDDDIDGDGTANEADCQPEDDAVHPGAAETCDGVDNNCDDVADDVSCDDGDPCTTDTCTGVQGCKHDHNSDPCNDDNPCTDNDVCSFGVCAGTFKDCDDQNPCTDDSCDPSLGCQHVDLTGACDDSNACTSDDQCVDGVCKGTPGLCGCETVADCNDSNDCTTDVCDPEVGCDWIYNSQPCDDGNPCTLADTCSGGVCAGGSPNTCEDFNPCTSDTCDQVSGCTNTPNTNPCNDDNACTMEDTCNAGVCGGAALLCDDGKACTSDACDKDTGCVYVTIGGPCEDGNLCTLGDTCEAGSCVSGDLKGCDDGNPCTADSCNPNDGACVNAPLDGGPCDDGSDCTSGDTCVAGVCEGTATAGCCGSDSDCDDGNPCTKDSCNLSNGQCSSSAEAMNGFGCNADHDGCTAGDTCQGGACVVGGPVDCSDQADACNDAVCESTGVQSYLCQPIPKGAGLPCEDGLFCTEGDTCDASGNCVAGAEMDCSGAAGGCISGTCDETADACVGDPLPNGTPCNADNNGCTVGDTCQAGSCEGGSNADCSWQDAACIVGVCVPDGPANPHGYQCEAQLKPVGTPCEDTEFCTVNESCDATGWCGGGDPNPCSDVADACNTGTCDEDADSCAATPVTNGTTCQDGDSCTVSDVCQDGQCVGSQNVCGEYKVSTFETGLGGYAPAIADKGDGEYAVFWQDDSGDFVNGRSYTNSWSKEWTEFSLDGADDDLSVDAAGLPDGGTVLASTWRTKSYSNSGKWCWQWTSTCSSGSCSSSGSYSHYKYDGSRSIQERIYLTYYGADNQVVASVGVYLGDNSSSWSSSCNPPSAYTYQSNFGNLKVAAAPNGNVFIMWQRGSTVYGRIYNPAQATVEDFGSLGSSWSGYDVAAHSDDSFIVVWSSGGDIFGQLYTATGDPDGAQITVSDAAGSQTYPALDTYTNGRFVVAWRDGTDQIVTRVFKKEGTPVGPVEVVANTTVATSANPAVGAYDLSGSFVVAWESGTDVRAQFFDKNAATIGDEKLVNIQANAAKPYVTVLSTDEGVVAWRTSDGQIRARKYDPNGDALEHSPELTHNEATDFEQSDPDGVAIGASNYVVAWQTGTAANDLEISARLFDLTGAPAGPEFTVNSTAAGWQTAPAVGSDSTGDFVVAWESYGQDGDVEGVYARTFAVDGTPVSAEIAVNETTVYEQFEPDIAVDRTAGADGNFAVVWSTFEHPAGAVYDVMVRCFDANGNPLGAETMVNETTDNDQRMAAVTRLAAGPSRYIASWASKNEDGDNWGIYARRLSASCAPQGSAFQVNTATTNVQSQPAITSASDGSFLIAWRSLNQDGSNYGVYAQRFDSSGAAVDTEFKLNTITANEQSSPALAFLADDSLVAGWMTLGEDENAAAVKFAHFAPDLTSTGLEFLGNIYYQGNQDSPNIVALPNGDYVILWRSDGQDGAEGTIVGRVLP